MKFPEKQEEACRKDERQNAFANCIRIFDKSESYEEFKMMRTTSGYNDIGRFMCFDVFWLTYAVVKYKNVIYSTLTVIVFVALLTGMLHPPLPTVGVIAYIVVCSFISACVSMIMCSLLSYAIGWLISYVFKSIPFKFTAYGILNLI